MTYRENDLLDLEIKYKNDEDVLKLIADWKAFKIENEELTENLRAASDLEGYREDIEKYIRKLLTIADGLETISRDMGINC